MDLAQRRLLIRSMLHARGAIVPVPKAKRPRRVRYEPKPEKAIATFPDCEGWNPRCIPEWVKTGESVPLPTPRPNRRRKGKAALTLISEQFPRKLLRNPASFGPSIPDSNSTLNRDKIEAI